ncbi:hypothetical protein ACWD33_00220 [Streptomyces xiamenensis]|uniref:hypothetical protein n=1 Tax=Streptomyces xiamenensis TaxID=408015 RepID=UPI0035DF4C2E
MSVQPAPEGDCPLAARADHRRAERAFRAERERLAAGHGIPEALAYSPEATRQWVSDELTAAAHTVADRARAAGPAWLRLRARRTTLVLWSAVFALLLGQALTAMGSGWTLPRTAALLAAVLLAAPLTAVAWLHRDRGGVLAPLIGPDNRVSTSRTVAAGWLLLAAYAVLTLALTLAGTDDPARRAELRAGLDLPHGGGLLTVVALGCAVALWTGHAVAHRVRHFRAQKVRALRPRALDPLTDDSGGISFTAAQYVLVNTAALVFAAVQLTRDPYQLPSPPWALAALVAISALGYAAAKLTEGGRPVIQSVVRVREPGAPHSPIRYGDELEIRGSGFVPPGAEAADLLAGTTVRIGDVLVPVPLVPVPGGGFANPSDTVLRLPVPAELDPGPVDIQVITAAGTESGRYPITVAD